ncbi:hypothetical protein V8C86DRAFT_3090655 [Haematococcus lacustris]
MGAGPGLGEVVEGSQDTVMQLSNGCLCCTVRDDLIQALNRLVGGAAAAGTGYKEQQAERDVQADTGSRPPLVALGGVHSQADSVADSADGYLSEMDRLTKLLDDLQQVDASFDEAAWPAPGTDYVFDMVMGLKQRRREAIRYEVARLASKLEAHSAGGQEL